MPIESGADLVMALLYAPGGTGKVGEEIRGITRLEKLVFLLIKEAGFESRTKGELYYEAYDYGPYSGELVDIIDALKGEGLVQSQVVSIESFKEVADGLVVAASRNPDSSPQPRGVEIYGLSRKGTVIGKAVFGELSNNDRDAVMDIKKRFNRVSLNELLRYVYERYPKMVEKSKIMDQILGLGSRPDLPAFEDAE